MTLQCSIEMHNIGYAWRGLKEQLGDEIDNKVTRMRFLKGKMVRWLILLFVCLVYLREFKGIFSF